MWSTTQANWYYGVLSKLTGVLDCWSQSNFQWIMVVGQSKPLNPSLWTPTMEQICTVHRLPAIQTCSMDHPQNRIKMINKDDTYRLSNGSLVLVKFQMLHCANVTNLGSGLGTSDMTTHCHFLNFCGYSRFSPVMWSKLKILTVSEYSQESGIW